MIFGVDLFFFFLYNLGRWGKLKWIFVINFWLCFLSIICLNDIGLFFDNICCMFVLKVSKFFLLSILLRFNWVKVLGMFKICLVLLLR